MSNVKKQISIQEFVRNKVMKVLDLTPERYMDYVIEQGMAYLEDQLGNALMGKKLSANALFWAWWRNHWHDTDMEFLDSIKHMNDQERRVYYEILHDYQSFPYRPQKAVIQDALNHIKNTQIVKHHI